MGGNSTIQKFVPTINEEDMQAPHNWPFVSGIHGRPLDSLTNGK